MYGEMTGIEGHKQELLRKEDIDTEPANWRLDG